MSSLFVRHFFARKVTTAVSCAAFWRERLGKVTGLYETVAALRKLRGGAVRHMRCSQLDTSLWQLSMFHSGIEAVRTAMNAYPVFTALLRWSEPAELEEIRRLPRPA